MKMITAVMPHPEKGYLNNTKLSNCLPFCGPLSTGKSFQVASLSQKRTCITASFVLSEQLLSSRPEITPFDLAVMDCVYTLFLYGVSDFTPEMVARILSGKLDKDVTREHARTICRSLDKLSLIQIRIDCSSEFQQRKIISKEQKVQYTTYLLPLEQIQVLSANHQAVMNGYHLIQKPALFEYAEKVHQIISFPLELLQAGALSDTPEALLLKRTLLRRIECMKSEKNHYCSRDIRYERYDNSSKRMKGLFSEIGICKEAFSTCSGSWWRKKRSTLHQKVTAILDSFVTASYIAGYRVLRDGQTVTGVRIRLFNDSS